MRGFVAVGILAACASTEPARPSSGTPSTPTHGGVATPPAPAVVTGSHGAPIELLAVTPEGDAVVSVDRRGGVRLWPTLDGRREPVVLHADRPQELAIAHAGDGFVIASIDGARGLELIVVGGDGVLRGRTKPRGEAVADIVLTGGHVIVLRADQTLERLGVDGERTGTLVPDAGTRVVRLVTAGGRVLAFGERGRARFVRWIDPRSFAWGAATTVGRTGEPIAASPDGAYLVANQGTVARSISLATGKQGPAICNQRAARTLALGFVAPDTLACLVDGRLVWWSMSKGTIVRELSNSRVDPQRDAVGHGVVVAADDKQLALYGEAGPMQLGYAIAANPLMRFSADAVAIAGAGSSVIVDATLRGRRVDLPPAEGVLPLGDGYAVKLSAPEVSANDVWGESHALSLYDVAEGRSDQQLSVRTSELLVFERATGLLATIDGAIVRLLRYDARTQLFGAPIEVVLDNGIHRVALLDPALASGLAALTVEERMSSVIIGEIEARDLGAKRVRVRRTFPVTGQFLAIDRAGRIYTRTSSAVVHVQQRGRADRELFIDGYEVAPSADGARLAVVGKAGLALYTADGAQVWTTPISDIRSVHWLGDSLIVSFANALARVDVATGRLVARQCGWDFGLRPPSLLPPPRSSSETKSVCDAD